MLPALDRLHLSRTGEFHPLSQPELKQFTDEEKVDPITLESFERDGNDWRTFRVRNETPRADGTYKYHYYKASALWRHYDSPRPKKDPMTNQPIWYEDWMALHDAYDTEGGVPEWVYGLPTREPGTVKAPPPMAGTFFERAETPPSSPTPIWVYRQPNRPQLSDEDRESERLYAARNRAREHFDRLLQLDDPGYLNALRNAMRYVELAGEAIQEFLDRRAASENDPNGLRTLQARLEQSGTRDMTERTQRRLDEARARWERRREVEEATQTLREI
jgi:hypothetical protein